MALHAEMKTPPVEPRLRLARVELVAGRLGEARRLVLQALEGIDRQRDLYEAEGRALLAEILLAGGDREGAAREAALGVAAGKRTGAIGIWLPAAVVLAIARGDHAELEAVAAQAADQGYLGLALEARLAIGDDPAAVVRDAEALGQLWIAKRAKGKR
jgi:hypothetical protein